MKRKTFWIGGVLISLGVLFLIFTFAIIKPVEKSKSLAVQIEKAVVPAAADSLMTEVIDLDTPEGPLLTFKKNIVIKLSGTDWILAMNAYIKISPDTIDVFVILNDGSTKYWYIDYAATTKKITIDGSGIINSPGLTVVGYGSGVVSINIKGGGTKDIICLSIGYNVYVDGGGGEDICIGIPEKNLKNVEKIYFKIRFFSSFNASTVLENFFDCFPMSHNISYVNYY